MKNGQKNYRLVVGLALALGSASLCADVQNSSLLGRIGSTAYNAAYGSVKAVALSPYYLTKSVLGSLAAAGAHHGKFLVSNYILYLQPELVPFVSSCYGFAEQMIYNRQDLDAEAIAVSVLEAAFTASAMSFLTPVAVTMIKPVLKPAIVSMVQQMRAVVFGTTGALAQKQRQESLMQSVRQSLFKAVTQGLVSVTMNITGILALKNATDSLYAAGDTQATYFNTATKIVNTISVKSLLFKGVCHDAQLHGALERLTTGYSADIQVRSMLGSYVQYLGGSVQAYHSVAGHVQDGLGSVMSLSPYSMATKAIANWSGVAAAVSSTDALYNAGDQGAGYFGTALNVFSTVAVKTFVPNAHDGQLHGALERTVTGQRFAAEMYNMSNVVAAYMPVTVAQGFKAVCGAAQYLHTTSASLHDGQGVTGVLGSLASTDAYNTVRVLGSAARVGWNWFSGR